MAQRFTPYPLDRAFEHAEAFLAGGKSKTDRPVANNTRLRRVDADTIALVLHTTAVVSYHRYGAFTIYGGGWDTVTTKKRIRDFSPVRPHGDGKGSWIIGTTGERTAPKVQRCRTCKGAGGDVYAERCYPRWSERGGGHCRCPHGSNRAHDTGQWLARECYRCHGAGEVDYGSKPVPVLADADTPFRVDATGTLLGFCEPVHAGSTYVASSYSPHDVGAELVDRLATVLPNVRAKVIHPVSQCPTSLKDAVVSLNDAHRWSREQIADWLDTLDLDLRFPVSS